MSVLSIPPRVSSLLSSYIPSWVRISSRQKNPDRTTIRQRHRESNVYWNLFFTLCIVKVQRMALQLQIISRRRDCRVGSQQQQAWTNPVISLKMLEKMNLTIQKLPNSSQVTYQVLSSEQIDLNTMMLPVEQSSTENITTQQKMRFPRYSDPMGTVWYNWEAHLKVRNWMLHPIKSTNIIPAQLQRFRTVFLQTNLLLNQLMNPRRMKDRQDMGNVPPQNFSVFLRKQMLSPPRENVAGDLFMSQRRMLSEQLSWRDQQRLVSCEGRNRWRVQLPSSRKQTETAREQFLLWQLQQERSSRRPKREARELKARLTVGMDEIVVKEVTAVERGAEDSQVLVVVLQYPRTQSVGESIGSGMMTHYPNTRSTVCPGIVSQTKQFFAESQLEQQALQEQQSFCTLSQFQLIGHGLHEDGVLLWSLSHCWHQRTPAATPHWLQDEMAESHSRHWRVVEWKYDEELQGRHAPDTSYVSEEPEHSKHSTPSRLHAEQLKRADAQVIQVIDVLLKNQSSPHQRHYLLARQQSESELHMVQVIAKVVESTAHQTQFQDTSEQQQHCCWLGISIVSAGHVSKQSWAGLRIMGYDG